MSNQIFKSDFSNDILFDLLDEIHYQKTNKCYIVNSSSFKRALHKDLVKDFCNSLTEHYHVSKKFYIERELNYTKFMTVIRQICNKNHISFSTQIKYDKSSYDIHYFIYF
tara:strand:- start:531 stop:860 length:330 start_codon:yes stop_codon:yes gene_type:complete